MDGGGGGRKSAGSALDLGGALGSATDSGRDPRTVAGSPRASGMDDGSATVERESSSGIRIEARPSSPSTDPGPDPDPDPGPQKRERGLSPCNRSAPPSSPPAGSRRAGSRSGELRADPPRDSSPALRAPKGVPAPDPPRSCEESFGWDPRDPSGRRWDRRPGGTAGGEGAAVR